MAELYTLRPRFFWVNFFSTIDSPNISGKAYVTENPSPKIAENQIQDSSILGY